MILITGATGKIGKELVNDLTARKAGFKVMARSKEAVKAFESKGIKAVHADFTHSESLADALTGIQAVFLLTTPDPNCLAIEHQFIEACKHHNVKHIVRVSAIGANPWAASCLLRSHGQCELQLEQSGLAWTILRPTIFMQNLVPFMAGSVAKESTLYAPAGEARMPWVDTRDIAAVAGTVLTNGGHEGRVYELTGSESLTYDEVAGLLSRQLDRQIKYVDVPDGAAFQSMVGMGMSAWLADGMVTLYHQFKANGPTATVLGTVERISGHAPRTLAAYLKENEIAFRSQVPAPVARK